MGISWWLDWTCCSGISSRALEPINRFVTFHHKVAHSAAAVALGLFMSKSSHAELYVLVINLFFLSLSYRQEEIIFLSCIWKWRMSSRWVSLFGELGAIFIRTNCPCINTKCWLYKYKKKERERGWKEKRRARAGSPLDPFIWERTAGFQQQQYMPAGSGAGCDRMRSEVPRLRLVCQDWCSLSPFYVHPSFAQALPPTSFAHQQNSIQPPPARNWFLTCSFFFFFLDPSNITSSSDGYRSAPDQSSTRTTEQAAVDVSQPNFRAGGLVVVIKADDRSNKSWSQL